MTENFLIGTYTKKDSKGAYGVTLNTANNKLEDVHLVIPSEKPAYLQIASNGMVVAVRQEGDLGGIATYSINNGETKLLDKSLAAGAPPAYVAFDEARHLIFSANYHTALVNVYKYDNQGKLTLTDSVKHQGLTGPQPEQDAPHVHFADLTPDNKLIVCDLGMDLVVIYDVSDDGKLTALSRFKCEPGFGTRHLVFHPNGKIVYVLGELSSKLLTLKYHEKDHSLELLQTIKTIPDSWTAHNGAAAIHVTKDGKYLYISNRGENTIAVFAIQSDFNLKHIQSISTEGDFPRDFELSSDEQYLLASNQNSDNLTLYSRDSESGTLTLLEKDVKCPEPVCVKRWN